MMIVLKGYDDDHQEELLWRSTSCDANGIALFHRFSSYFAVKIQISFRASYSKMDITAAAPSRFASIGMEMETSSARFSFVMLHFRLFFHSLVMLQSRTCRARYYQASKTHTTPNLVSGGFILYSPTRLCWSLQQKRFLGSKKLTLKENCKILLLASQGMLC